MGMLRTREVIVSVFPEERKINSSIQPPTSEEQYEKVNSNGCIEKGWGRGGEGEE